MTRPRLTPARIRRVMRLVAAGVKFTRIAADEGLSVSIVSDIASGVHQTRMALSAQRTGKGPVVRCGCGRKVIDDGILPYCAACQSEKEKPADWMPRPGDDPNLRLELDADAAARLAEIQGGQVEFINRKRVRRIA